MVEKKDDDKNKKIDKAAIISKVNKSLKPKGIQISKVSDIKDGKLSAELSISEFDADRNFFANKDQLNKLVTERQVNRGSLYHKLNLNKTRDNFLRQIEIAGLRDIAKAVENGKGIEEVVKQVKQTNKEMASLEMASLNQRYRTPLSNEELDLREKTPDEANAVELYERSEVEYYRSGIYGSAIDALTDFTSTGFVNEIADEAIKEFYDSWILDTNFLKTVDKIINNLFKYGIAYVMPGTGSYEPNTGGISSLPGKIPTNTKKKQKEKATLLRLSRDVYEKVTGKKWTKQDKKRYDAAIAREIEVAAKKASGKMPIAYTLLNPKHMNVESSGFFGGATYTYTSKGLSGLKESVERQKKREMSPEEKQLIGMVPTKMKASAIGGDDYLFTGDELDVIFFRKDDHEAYAKPRGSRIFDAIDYKDELVAADFATLDGIFNYILKVTVGDKDHPVTDLKVLEDLAEAFNTPQKAFSVVWNHTLDIEKITTPDIGAILGKAKYEQVEMDIQAGLGISRAIIDGSSIQNAAAVLSSKSTQSQIDVVRRAITAWIYKQYKLIAEQNGFNSYPVVRWQQSVITTDSDAVTRASMMQMIDRKLVSRHTTMQVLGFDPEAEVEKMREELKLEAEGIGIPGSPFQQTSGDQGRPKGQPTGNKKPVDNTKTVTKKTKVDSPTQQKQTRTKASDNTNIDVEVEGLISNIRELPEGEKKRLITLLKSKK